MPPLAPPPSFLSLLSYPLFTFLFLAPLFSFPPLSLYLFPRRRPHTMASLKKKKKKSENRKSQFGRILASHQRLQIFNSCMQIVCGIPARASQGRVAGRRASCSCRSHWASAVGSCKFLPLALHGMGMARVGIFGGRERQRGDGGLREEGRE